MSGLRTPGAVAADTGAAPSGGRHYRVLVVTNLWPTDADPGYGSFVQALRPFGVAYDVLFIDGRQSVANYLRGIFEMRRRLATQPYDLIHAHFGLSGWAARLQARVPVVVSFMGDDVLGRFGRAGRVGLVGRVFRVSSFLLARLVAAVIVKSKPMKTRLRLASVHVIPNGVNLDVFRPMEIHEARQVLGLDSKRSFVLFPYDPEIPNKRYDLVQAAVRLAQRELPEVEILRVAGEPRRLMPLYLNAVDALALASHSEGSPNIVKEAMAVNLPVISVDVGDVAELIGPTEGCYIVPRRAEDIAARIVQVCRQGTRTRGREWIRAYAEECIARQIVAVYASVVGAK